MNLPYAEPDAAEAEAQGIVGVEMALVAGAWLGPILAMAAGLGLLALLGVQGEFITLLFAVALSLLAGAPMALLAARRGLLGWPLGLATLGLATGAAALAGFALFRLLDGLAVAEALAAALASAALALLWVGLGVAAGFGLPPLAWLAIGALAGSALAWLVGGLAGALGGLALGAALAGFLAAIPAAIPAAGAPTRLRPGAARVLAGQALAGLALALAVLAGPLSASILDDRLMAVTLALPVALPGLLLLAACRGLAPLPLASALLGLQTLAVALGLVIGGAPAAAGWIPAEALGTYRLALLGAGFLPAFAALAAALLARPSPGALVAAALVLAVLSAGLGPLLGLVQPGLADFGGLAAPVLATGFAFWLLQRGGA